MSRQPSPETKDYFVSLNTLANDIADLSRRMNSTANVLRFDGDVAFADTALGEQQKRIAQLKRRLRKAASE